MNSIGRQHPFAPRTAQTHASQSAGVRRSSTQRTSADAGQGSSKSQAAASTAKSPNVTPFSVEAAKSVTKSQAPQMVSSDAAVRTQALPGTIDFSQFTDVGIDRQASIAYGKIAESKNYAIDYLHNQAMENWELNGRRGPEPVKVAYHETDPEKIFNHLQAFRYGDVAIPDDGSGYLSVNGYMSASPHQQGYGKPAEQLTAYRENGYSQVTMPSHPATPRTSDILWGKATGPLKTEA